MCAFLRGRPVGKTKNREGAGMRRFYPAILLFFCLTGGGFSQTHTKVDSTLWMLSLPEIQSYRAYYLQEMDKLQQEKSQLIRRGIEDGERLLQSNPDF